VSEALRVARKELNGFFATPAAYLFLAAFLAVTLFVVFWVETFFARNIADLQPLFEWMPVLLVFLVAALTMRAWSEERRAGTLETLLTAPVAPLALVLGKFIAGLALVALALALTLPLPVTVALLGPLDPGPLIGGYIATLFLAAAYVAIGLYMSARTDNPIVALILTVAACGVFYLVGSDPLGALLGHEIGGLLALLGSGSRFESIARGVIDLRDLYYYVSLVGVFLCLNLYSLERLRWAGNPGGPRHRRWAWATGLVAANFLAANLWLAPIDGARGDITSGNLYTLSETTRQTLTGLQEPLTIRGYFSDKTHPLLAPLVPRIKDLLAEYRVAAGGRARVELVDPTRDRAAEEEAAKRYGIRPVPFQTADRYQAAVVSSYFDIVVAYGDQHETLGFRDLIEVKARGEAEIDVGLKNPEYALTRAIRKVVSAYRSGGSPFDLIDQPVTFIGYMSAPEHLPQELVSLREDLEAVLADMRARAGGELSVRFEDPEAGDGALAAELEERFGFGPQVASLLDPRPFWFYMVLESGGEAVQVPLPETLDKASLERSIEAALQRLTPGFLKTIALVQPPGGGAAGMGPMGRMGGGGPSYRQLEDRLRENYRIDKTDLASGRVPEAADMLVVLAPEALDEKQVFAIDQFLMRGGSVLLASSPFDVQVGRSLAAERKSSGLEDWLDQHGLTIGETMVLDPRSAALPVPVERNVAGIVLQEIQLLPYPHFPDLRGDSLDPEHPITAGLDQLTLNWVSPITVTEATQQRRSVTELLRSSPESWTAASLELVPDYRAHPDSGFPVSGDRGPRLLAVALEGRFESAFKGQPSPLARAGAPGAEGADAAGEAGAGEGEASASGEGETEELEPEIAGVIEKSPASARLVLVASNTFATDDALDLASQGMGTQYTQPLDFLQNAIDWSLEDRGLLALRGRSQFARTLVPLAEDEQRFWEYLNYALALAGLLGVAGWRRLQAGRNRQRYARILEAAA